MKHVPYTFSNLAKMKPGQIIEGIVLTEEGGFALGTGWDSRIIETGATEIPINVGFEYRLHLREKILSTYVTRSKAVIYHTNYEALREAREDVERSDGVVRFNVNSPIGIFLGHLIRADYNTFVNILTSDGQDIWF